MKKKFLAFSSFIGILINMVYTILNRRITISDRVAYPILIISIILIIIGCAYKGKCIKNHTNPYDFE